MDFEQPIQRKYDWGLHLEFGRESTYKHGRKNNRFHIETFFDCYVILIIIFWNLK